jgi:hypothetical protein
MNSTIALDELTDPTGAILFIIVVLFWYSMCMVCMLGMQIKARDETIEDCARRRAKLLIENLRDQTHTKQILGINYKTKIYYLILFFFGFSEELVDKQKRDRLWNIYLDRTDDNDKLIRADIVRIRNIEKQLAIINQNRIFINESLITNYCTRSDSQSTISPDVSFIENRARVRRRSSLDQQIIERWKCLVEQCKTHQQLPWKIQKLMIRRHFRRHYKAMLREPEQLEYIDDKQYNRQKSNHHTIQIDNDDY